MITPEQYWMGRDVKYSAELTGAIRANAAALLASVNTLLAFAEVDGVAPGLDQVTGTPVASGWRPARVNDRTTNASATSKHLTGQAVDLQDTRGRELARWCLANADALEELGLYMERPQWTAGGGPNGIFRADPWVHLQSVPPRSGRRIFVPSTAPAQVAALPGEVGIA